MKIHNFIDLLQIIIPHLKVGLVSPLAGSFNIAGGEIQEFGKVIV